MKNLKKNAARVIAICMVLAIFAFAAAGCGSSKPSLSDYVASSEFQEQFGTVKSQLESQGLQTDIKADGDVLVVEYKFSTQIAVTDEMKTQLEDSITSALSSLSESMLGEIKEETSVSNPTIRIVLLNNDGSEILTKDITE